MTPNIFVKGKFSHIRGEGNISHMGFKLSFINIIFILFIFIEYEFHNIRILFEHYTNITCARLYHLARRIVARESWQAPIIQLKLNQCGSMSMIGGEH